VRYLAHRPCPPLDEIVDSLWALSDAPGHARERIVPSGTIELVINLHDDAFRIHGWGGGAEQRFRGALVSGCYRSAFEIDTRAHARIVGVHFKPGGAARLLGAPAGELANAHVSLEALWGRPATELRERLCAAATATERFELLEQALVARLPDRPQPRDAVGAALAALEQPRVEIGGVTRALGLSHRRFIEIFVEDVGVSPKRYAMVRRFQRALAAALHSPSPAWARIALEHGYYDQAHLCRDWVELAGISPADLVELRAIPVKDNHVAIPAG
jgi:AraC-like DNA-binding protein